MTSACGVNWLSEFSSGRGLWQAHSSKSHRQILQRAPWQAGPSLTSPPVFLDLDWHFKWNNHGTSWKEAIFVQWHLYPLSVRQQRAVGELLGCRWSVWCVGEKDAVLTNVTSLTGSDAGCTSPLCLWVPSLYQIPPISIQVVRAWDLGFANGRCRHVWLNHLHTASDSCQVHSGWQAASAIFFRSSFTCYWSSACFPIMVSLFF